VISVLFHALLGLSVAALAGAALRVASLTGARGLDRALAALALGAAAAVGQALLLGLVRLGTSPVALSLAAGGTWLAARACLAAPSPRPLDELRDWWAGLGAPGRALVGAGAGALLAYTSFALRFPAIGVDGLTYHLPDVAGWVQNGSPGSAIDYFDELPTGSYPVTNEVLLSWLVGISRGLMPITLWPVATLVILALAGWRGLRLLGVPARAAGLAAAAFAASPLLLAQASVPNTDLPGTTWLVVAAALCAGVRSHPALLAPAIVAVGLAVGTKATPLVPAVAALAVAAVAARGSLRALVTPLALALAAALLVGGIWFARNVVVHGSPLWPLVAGPSGDPVPFVLRQIDGRLISDLGSLAGRESHYLDVLAGGVALIAGALLAPLLARRRAVALATAIAVLCVVVWASGPYTGYPRGPQYDTLAAGATRYLLPGLAAATLALALAARAGGLRAGVAMLVLGAALAWSVERSLALGFPSLPSAGLLIAGLALGAVTGLAAGGLARLPTPREPVLAVGLAAGCALLSLPAAGYVDRHLRVDVLVPDYVRWIGGHESFDRSDRAITSVGGVNGALAGPHLRHPVRLLPADESCRELRRRAQREWVVLPRPVRPVVNAIVRAPPASTRRLNRLRGCLAETPPAFEGSEHLVYGPP
jgi:hypothetical protein